MAARVLIFDYPHPDGQCETGNELCMYFIEISRTTLTPYVIGRERGTGEVWPYKLSRMVNLKLHADRYDPDPLSFLSDAWGTIGGAMTSTVKVRFSPEVAYQVINGGWKGKTLLREDGSVEMKFRATLDEHGLPQKLVPCL